MARTVFSACLLILAATGCSATGRSSAYQEGEDLPGGTSTNTFLFGKNALSRHADNISVEHEEMFFSGNGFFNQAWVTAPSSTEASDGLGPLFNAKSCSACHADDGRGRPPLLQDEAILGILFRVSVTEDDEGMPVGDAIYGDQIQPYAIADVLPEAQVAIRYEEVTKKHADGTRYQLLVPNYELSDLSYDRASSDAILSPRVAPGMQGLGLLEAIPEARLEELADEEDEDGDGISGRIRLVPDKTSGSLRPGRFGWKNEQPSIFQQTAGAFLGDMGLTTSLTIKGAKHSLECTSVQVDCLEQPSGAKEGEPEVSDKILSRVVLYSQLLAVPMRDRAHDDEVLQGKELFFQIGCQNCHTPSHNTGKHELDELSNQLIFPYTDLLLHDMGRDLADGEGRREIHREWRTAPLWALRYYSVVNQHDRLLHDGRARGIEEAIMWHGGEAEAAREDFSSLTAAERALLIQFVESL